MGSFASDQPPQPLSSDPGASARHARVIFIYTGDGRIIFLTCKAHEFVDGWNPEKMNLEYTEDCMQIEAFNVSKLCNVRLIFNSLI